MSFTTFKADELCISPLNVRKDKQDAEDTAWLEDSISSIGLIFPLVVHPMDNGLHGVLDGGRRFLAITRLIEKGCIAPDWAVPCTLRDHLTDAEIRELSLSANLPRRDLHPWEVHSAIADAHEDGDSPEQIAHNIGQTPHWVRQQLRLGRLAPEIFAAYAEGELSIEQARAYAATEDRDLQLAAWAHFEGLHEWDHNERAIRAFMKVGDREEAKLLRFVGEEVYRAAGGGFELDLFFDGPEHRGRVTDEALLMTLVENKLGQLRQELRRFTKRSDLRFLAEPPKRHGAVDRSLAIDADDGQLPPETQGAEVAATIAIAEDGTHEVAFWWPSHKAKRDAIPPRDGEGDREAVEGHGESGTGPAAYGKAFSAGEALDPNHQYEYARAARAFVKEEHGLTAEGLQVMRALRRELLRALLVQDASDAGTLGRDYLVWAQLREELGPDSWKETGARGLASPWTGAEDQEPADVVAPHLEQADAHAVWRHAIARLQGEPFLTIEDPAEAFAAYAEALEPVKNIAAAVLAGIALVRSANVPGWRVPVHDRLAAMAGGHDRALRALWQPTPDFAALFPKLKRLELAQQVLEEAGIEPQAFATWHRRDDRTITGAVTEALQSAQNWVHPLLSFNAANGTKRPFPAPPEPAEGSTGDPLQLPSMHGARNEAHEAAE